MNPYYYATFGERDQFRATSAAELLADAPTENATAATLRRMDRLADGRDASPQGEVVLRATVEAVAQHLAGRASRTN